MSQAHSPYPPTPPPLPPGAGGVPFPSASPPFQPAAERADRPLMAEMEPAYEVRTPMSGRQHRASRGSPSRSGLAWGAAAVCAAAYLTIVVVRPDLVATLDNPAPALAEIETLRGEVDGLRRDVAEIRTTVTETATQQKVISERLSALGAPAAGAIPASQAAGPAPPLRLESAPVNAPLSPRADASTVAPSDSAAKRIADAKVLNAKPALETGSVKPAAAPAAPTAVKPAAAPAEAPPFSAPVVTPAGKPVAVQIASGSSVDSLRLSWNLLSETHADKLKSLEPRYSLSVDGGAVVYNLMAGPVTSEAEAKKMCKALAQKAIPCKVLGEFGGAPL